MPVNNSRLRASPPSSRRHKQEREIRKAKIAVSIASASVAILVLVSFVFAKPRLSKSEAEIVADRIEASGPIKPYSGEGEPKYVPSMHKDVTLDAPLRDSMVYEWRAASVDDQMDTAAFWMRNIDSRNADNVQAALWLRHCINAAIKDNPGSDSMRSGDIAGWCVVLDQ